MPMTQMTRRDMDVFARFLVAAGAIFYARFLPRPVGSGQSEEEEE